MRGIPKAILLATDLSARCDRALDRAGLLETEWKCQLIALHVVEPRGSSSPLDASVLPSWRQPEDPKVVAARQLRSSLFPDFSHVTAIVETGETTPAILMTAEAHDCGLIVTGMARSEELGRYSLGGNVERLVRRSKIPVLIVKNRARKPYGKIIVATDFSPSSAHALEAAARLFPDRVLTLFHVTDAPFTGLVSDRDDYIRQHRDAARAECEDFLGKVDIPESVRKTASIVVENRPLVELLHQYVRDFDVDLVVLGTHGRSGIFNLLLGSVATAILGALPCDALVVREPRATVQSSS